MKIFKYFIVLSVIGFLTLMVWSVKFTLEKERYELIILSHSSSVEYSKKLHEIMENFHNSSKYTSEMELLESVSIIAKWKIDIDSLEKILTLIEKISIVEGFNPDFVDVTNILDSYISNGEVVRITEELPILLNVMPNLGKTLQQFEELKKVKKFKTPQKRVTFINSVII